MTVRIEPLEALPRELLERFADKDGLLWTGAGVSRQTMEVLADGTSVEVGVPTGEALQRRLTALVEGPRPQPETLESVATVYEAQRGRPQLEELLGATYRAEGVIAPRFYSLVTDLPPEVRTFVTTNYDPFLERALAHRRPVVVVRDHGLDDVTETRPVVYKPHGDAQQPAGCVITTPDYVAWDRTTGDLPATLTTLFLQRTVVALGYRAQDSHFQRLLERVNAGILARGSTPRRMYVVVPDATENAFAAYHGSQYDLVLVPTTGEAFLEWLIRGLADVRRERAAAALNRLIESPAVTPARAAVWTDRPPTQAAVRDADPAAEAARARRFADAVTALADALFVEGRDVEALHEQARAVKALHDAGDPERAEALHLSTLRKAIHDRRDGRLAETLHGMMQVDSRVGFRAEPSSDEIRFAAAFAAALAGFPGREPTFVAELDARLASAPDEEHSRLQAMSARIRAEYAVTALDFEAAARWYERCADLPALDDTRAPELRIRARFFAGLSPDPSRTASAIEGLRALPVHPDVEALRQRAIGWLSAVAGEMDAAATAFDTAARIAVEANDVLRAASGFRGAEWVDRQRPHLVIRLEGPGRAAYRLEQSQARAATRTRETVASALGDADRALAGRREREAMFTAYAAQRLAYDELDPAGLENARARLDTIWTAILPMVSDPFSLVQASFYSGVTRGDADDRAGMERAASLLAALSTRTTAEVRRDVIRMLAREPVGALERVGMLLLLADLAPILSPDAVAADVVPAIEAALADPPGRMRRVDATAAASRLASVAASHMNPADAARVQARLVTLIEATPVNERERLYIAFANVTFRAALPPDNGAALAATLLQTFKAAREGTTAHRVTVLPNLGIAAAALAIRTSGGISEELRTTLASEGRAGIWDGIDTLIRRGAPIDRALADEYLRQTGERLRQLSVPASPNAFGPSFGDDRPMAHYAAEHATAEVRDETITAAIRLLRSDQWSVNRAKWVPLLVRLARTTPGRLRDAVQTLLPLARGHYADPRPIEEVMPDHPLSAIRLGAGRSTDLRSWALVGLGALWGAAPAGMRRRIRATVETGRRDSNPHVRAATVRAVREALIATAIGGAAGRSRGLLDRALDALTDPAPEVREAATDALRRYAEKTSGAEDGGDAG